MGQGHPSNGSIMVYFPERGTHFISPRFHFRPINLGDMKQMSLEEGKKYMSVMGADGE